MLLLIKLNCDGWGAWLPWLLGAFLLGALLGWLLNKLFGGDSDNGLQGRYDRLQADLDACRRDSKLSANLAGGSVSGASSFAAGSTKKKSASKPKAVKADDSVKDDLTKVEGIGPKIQGILNKDGIWSWKQLSEASESRVQKLLDAAGPAYTIHKPKTWAEQALMANKGQWEKLQKWQDELKGGL
ncbi:MAG: hypothetical protein V3U80_04135 [Flavobacteriaceae bacterium]